MFPNLRLAAWAATWSHTGHRGVPRRRRKWTRRPICEQLEDRRVLSVASPQIELFSLSPALFVENQGQWADESVRFLHNGNGSNVAMTDAGPVFHVFRTQQTDHDQPASLLDGFDPLAEGEPLAMESRQFSASFVDANAVTPVGLQQAASQFNYYIGDRSSWRTDVPGFEVVAYQGVYDGIDLHTFGQRANLKYEFLVAPGADPAQIVVRYDGIEGLSINDAGELVVTLGEGWAPLVDAVPYAYQDIGDQRVKIESRYALLDEVTYTFDLGEYSTEYELVIDPHLAWSTHLGGSLSEDGYGVAVDAQNNALVVGVTDSTDLVGVNNTNPGGAQSAFVFKVNTAGQLVWATYLGGSWRDYGHGIATDAEGNAWVTGTTSSSDFGGAKNSYPVCHSMAFVSKVGSNGQLAWSIYIGGTWGWNDGYGIATDSAGDATITGSTSCADLPAANNGYPGGSRSGFVAKVSGSGELRWSTYLGGSRTDWGYGIDVDHAGDALVTGRTTSRDFRGANNTAFGPHASAFLAKVSGSGELAWTTYLSAMIGSDFGFGVSAIAVDSYGNALVTGTKPHYPELPGANNSFPGGQESGFASKVNGAGQLVWATHLGGPLGSYANGIAADAEGNALVTGRADCGWLAAINGCDYFRGNPAFLARLNSAGQLTWAMYIQGRDGGSMGRGIGLDATGNALLTGYTEAEEFPAASSTKLGYSDAFLSKIAIQTDAPFTRIALWGERDYGTQRVSHYCACGVERRGADWLPDRPDRVPLQRE